MSQYNILFSLGKNAYLEDAPILLEAGALVHNTENKRVHIQLKFKNLSNVRISMVKAELVLMDSVGREIGRTEKQYIDLNANPNESFGDKGPVFLKDDTTRKFSATIKEVCFTDGGIWSAPQNVVFEEMPTPTAITQKLTTQEALDEFKILYCEQARYIPFVYKDVWVCSCGNINKTSQEKCCACNAKFSDMEKADNETLKKNNIYRNATELVKENRSFKIQEGIALFGRIPDWKDSTTKLEEAKQKLSVVWQNNKFAREQAAKRKKKNIIIAAVSCAAVAVLIASICIGSAISKANKYRQAQEYMSQQKYSEAMDLLDDLDGYKDADELYARAVNMYNGNYKYIVNMDNLTEFVIPDGVTSIGGRAFSGCSGLTSVTIPDSVTSIGGRAFSGCSSLTSVTIPCSVTSIDDNAFSGCSKLTSITIPDSVMGIGDGAFYNCSGLKEIIWNAKNCSTAGSLSSPIFDYCKKLTKITIGKNVKHIPGYAFMGCSSLTSIIIPDSVTSIGYGAFASCGSLTSITIPDSVTSIDDSAFAYCSGLKEIIWNAKNCSNAGTSYSPIFEGCNNVTKVTIGHVKKIPAYAFSGCRGLKSITIPSNVNSIGEKAFYNCPIENAKIPALAINYIANESLKNVVITSGSDIGSSAFSGCSSLTSITIPDSVTSIGDYAFKGCGSLTSIVIPDSVTSIGYGAFAYCSSLTSVTIPDGVTSIGYGAFAYCSSLTSVTIPDGVMSIGEVAFYNCSSLTSVTIPDGVTSIGDGAFECCSSLTSITIPDSVTSIGGYAFYNCSSLTSITIPDGITSIGECAFYNCSSLTSITIPDSVTSIGRWAFYGCSKLKTVYYKGTESDWKAISIGGNNSRLTSATIHYNVDGMSDSSDSSSIDTPDSSDSSSVDTPDSSVDTPATESVSIDMMGTTNLQSRTTEKTTYTANGITYVNDKASSTTDNYNQTGTYSARAYQGSTITISYAAAFTKVVFTLDDFTDGKYLTGFDGMTIAGATISRDNDVVTITFSSAVTSFTTANLVSQVRIENIELAYLKDE